MKIAHFAPLAGAFLVAFAAAVTPSFAQNSPSTDEGKGFGAELTIDRNAAVPVSAVFAKDDLRDTTVLVAGTIADVCTQKGCWLVVSDGKKQMRVTFKDYAFFVPKDCHNRQVLLQGVVTTDEISEEQAKHYASEATSGPKPEEIKGNQMVITMEASGVIILDNDGVRQ